MSVVGTTVLLTKDNGEQAIEECVDKITCVWNGMGWVYVVPYKTPYTNEMYEVTLSTGDSIICTPYHVWVLENKVRKKAEKLAVGDVLHSWTLPSGQEQSGVEVTSIEQADEQEYVYNFIDCLNHTAFFNNIVTAN